MKSAAEDAAMRVLVTGATGYIGGRLIPRLLDEGHQVRVLVRSDILRYLTGALRRPALGVVWRGRWQAKRSAQSAGSRRKLKTRQESGVL